MAGTQELDESMVVSDDEDLNGGGSVENYDGASEAGAALKKSRVKRASVKSMEGRVAAIDQRLDELAQELAQISRMREQLAQLNGKITRLEESVAARTGDGASSDGPALAEHVRVLDERLQKITYMLAQQNWTRP